MSPLRKSTKVIPLENGPDKKKQNSDVNFQRIVLSKCESKILKGLNESLSLKMNDVFR